MDIGLCPVYPQPNWSTKFLDKKEVVVVGTKFLDKIVVVMVGTPKKLHALNSGHFD
jgi:hypothetical protein